MQLGWRVGSHARSAPIRRILPVEASAPLSRAARQLLQHCLNTAQQGPRRQLQQSLALTHVRLTAGASGRLCARQESKGSRTEAAQRGKGGLRGKCRYSQDRQWRQEKKEDRDKSFHSCLCLTEVRRSCEQPSLIRHHLPFQQWLVWGHRGGSW